MYFVKHLFCLSLLMARGGLLGFSAMAAENPCPEYLMVQKWVPLPEATQKIIKQAVAGAEKVSDENFAYQIYAGIKEVAAENPAVKVGWEGPGGDVFLPSPRAMVVIYRPNEVVDYYYFQRERRADAFSLRHWQIQGKQWPKIIREVESWDEGMPKLFSYMLQGDFGKPPELNPQRNFFLTEPSLALLRERVQMWGYFLEQKYGLNDDYDQEKEQYSIYLDRNYPGRSIWRVQIMREADGRIKNYELYKYLAIVLPGGMEDSISFPMQRFSAMAEVGHALANDIGNTLELPIDGKQMSAAAVNQTFSKLEDLLAMQKKAVWRRKPLGLERIQSLRPIEPAVGADQYFNEAQEALDEIYPVSSKAGILERNKHWARIFHKYIVDGPRFFPEYVHSRAWHGQEGNPLFTLEIDLADGEREYYFVEDHDHDALKADSSVWKMTTKFGGVPFTLESYRYQDQIFQKNIEVIKAARPIWQDIKIDNFLLHLVSQVYHKGAIVDLRLNPHYLANLAFPQLKHAGFQEMPVALKKVVEDYCAQNQINYELVEESVRIGEFWRYAFRLHNNGKGDSSFGQEVTLSFKVNADGEPQYQLDRQILVPHRSAELVLPAELRLPPFEITTFDDLWLKVGEILAGYARASAAEYTPQILRTRLDEIRD